ncbi:sialate O-acetylesterase [Persicirhabdus sediminis]|uniref:Sialate O-acetylesterase domain-containing protein n=1 Tax=Persicirhabdus sediminis TaxID=454144 RepID=A0A8J7SP27_9BACT|nr:sialate O-acetylesterase [Persicirhabdus sediminis]MBK1792063.1 hypothetical protein [Persicirhabdus sediminis]
MEKHQEEMASLVGRPLGKFRMIAYSALILANTVAFSQAADIRTWIVSGQSNAQGYGITSSPVKKLAPSATLGDIGRSDLNVTHENVRFYHGASDGNTVAKSAGLDMAPKDLWHAMLPYEGLCYDWGSGFGSESGRRFGPELSFGAKVQQHLGEEIAIIKYARGGTSIAPSTKKQLSDGSYNDFVPDSKRPNQYQNLFRTLEGAVQSLADGDRLIIEGVIWMQGEADAKAANAAQYEANLTEFISEFRKDLAGIARKHPTKLRASGKWQDTRFYIGLIASSSSHGKKVRSAMQSVADRSRFIQTVDAKNGISKMTKDDWSEAGIHYDTKGQVTLGERFADAVISNVD